MPETCPIRYGHDERSAQQWFCNAIVMAVCWMTLTTEVSAAPGEVLIGQSLPLRGAGYLAADRVRAGAEAAVVRINASGGIGGRSIRLVTMDDAGDPNRHIANLQQLIRDGAAAIVNCIGDRACADSAAATAPTKTLMVGPMSGAAGLRSSSIPHVVAVRPPYTAEAQALVAQMHAMRVSRIALIFESDSPERVETLTRAIHEAGMTLTPLELSNDAESLERTFSLAADGAFQVAILSLGYRTIDTIARERPAAKERLPAMLMTLSSPGLTMLAASFRKQAIGYTTVVPNPELANLKLVTDLQADSEGGAGPAAVSFEGLEAYVNVRLAAQILRRAGLDIAKRDLTRAIDGMGTIDLGGFRLTPRVGKSASTFLEMGYREREGKVLR